MGIAAYNRGSRAISAYIDQQSQERRTVQPKESRPVQWSSPAGWFRQQCEQRDARANRAWLIEENDRRRKFGLPEYGIPEA